MASELCEGYISKSKDFIGIRKELMFWDKSTKGKQTMNQTKTKKSQKHKFMGKETGSTVEMGEGRTGQFQHNSKRSW